jgi:hypothetical protein
MTRDTDVLNAREPAVPLRAHVETVRLLGGPGEIPSFEVGEDWRLRQEARLRSAADKPVVTSRELGFRAAKMIEHGVRWRMPSAVRVNGEGGFSAPSGTYAELRIVAARHGRPA